MPEKIELKKANKEMNKDSVYSTKFAQMGKEIGDLKKENEELKNLKIDWLIELPKHCNKCSYFEKGGTDGQGDYDEDKCSLLNVGSGDELNYDDNDNNMENPKPCDECVKLGVKGRMLKIIDLMRCMGCGKQMSEVYGLCQECENDL